MKYSGQLNHPRENIFPIFRIDKFNCFFLVGTGFFIADDGIFITAKHVIEEVTEKGDSLALLHIYGEKSVMRKMAFYTSHPKADIAVGMLDRLIFKDTGVCLRNDFSAISFDTPEINDHLYTYTYPKTEIKYEEVQHINVVPTEYDGKVVEIFPDGRDSVMLPSACYQVDMGIIGGASGGPVFNDAGKVVAINSTSYEKESISFISCIRDAFEINVYKNAPIPNSFIATSVLELIKKYNKAFKRN